MKPRRSRSWIWFFVVLGVLTVTAIVVQVWFNVQQQLTPEMLAEARAKWKKKGPKDYDLEYLLGRVGVKDLYHVEVRGGKVVLSTFNGQVEEEGLLHTRDMGELFRFIQDYLEQDKQPGKPRVYVTATFDPEDGHVTHYVRSVIGQRSSPERQEITIKQFKLVGKTIDK